MPIYSAVLPCARDEFRQEAGRIGRSSEERTRVRRRAPVMAIQSAKKDSASTTMQIFGTRSTRDKAGKNSADMEAPFRGKRGSKYSGIVTQEETPSREACLPSALRPAKCAAMRWSIEIRPGPTATMPTARARPIEMEIGPTIGKDELNDAGHDEKAEAASRVPSPVRRRIGRTSSAMATRSARNVRRGQVVDTSRTRAA